MTKYTKEEMVATFSDYHKEVYGTRPSPDHRFYSLDIESMHKEWDYLGEQFVENNRIEAKMKDRAIASFNSLIEKTIELGANSRAQAIKWLMDAEDFFTDINHSDGGYFCYLNNLPYSMEKEFNDILRDIHKKRRGV